MAISATTKKMPKTIPAIAPVDREPELTAVFEEADEVI